MSKEAKKARARKKAFKKAIRLFFVVFIIFPILAIWFLMSYAEIVHFFERFTLVPVETAEVDSYYNLLAEHEKPGALLVTDLDVFETENLEVALRALQKSMGMARDEIKLAYDSNSKRPAYIRKEDDDITIFISTRIKKRREQINLLVHELGHIYVWRLKESIFAVLDQEKLVDISGVFLGLGILTLNGFTDDYRVLPEGGFHANQKNFGYLKPEQFGYLLARFCDERGIEDSAVLPHLEKAGRKYFKIGSTYLRKQREGIQIPVFIQKAQVVIRQGFEALRQKFKEAGIPFPRLPWDDPVFIIR